MAFHASRSHQSHVTRLVLFTHHTSRPQLLSQFLIASHSRRLRPAYTPHLHPKFILCAAALRQCPASGSALHIIHIHPLSFESPQPSNTIGAPPHHPRGAYAHIHMPSIGLSWTDHFIGRAWPASLALSAAGNALPPEEQHAHIMRPLHIMKAVSCFFSQRSPTTGNKRHRQQSPSPGASESLRHASRIFSSFNPSRHVRLCRNWLPTSGGCALQCARDRQGNMALCRMGYGPCDARRSEASAGAARALLVPALALALRVTSTAANAGWLSGMLLQDRVAAAGRCIAFIHRVQAAAAAHVAHRPDILQYGF